MPEEQEIETGELQETIQELQEERRERQDEERRAAWTRYIALTTAILAVFAAIGALESGTMVNEAMAYQLRASDTWNEYQADRQKELLYTLQADGLVDRGARLPAEAPAESGSAHGTPSKPVREEGGGQAPGAGAESPRRPPYLAQARTPSQRLALYAGEARREAGKEAGLGARARELEHESQHRMHTHHAYARSVAFIQVAIALSAVAALTRIRPVWLVSLAVGAAGLFFFGAGLLAK